MAQRRSTSGGGSGGAGPRPGGAARARSKPATRPGRSSSTRSAAGNARSPRRKPVAASQRPAPPGDVSAKTVEELREALRQNLIRPLDMMMITRERIEQVLDEAVERGQITVDGAQGIVSGLVERGRKQTNDVLRDLEQLLDRGRGELDERTSDARTRATDAARDARKQVSGARTRATRTASPALAQADRLRRAVGVGPSFPITGYGELTASQVQDRLGDLSAPELRKVRDYERRNANRKTVLGAIESKLG